MRSIITSKRKKGQVVWGMTKENARIWYVRMTEVARTYSPMGDPNGGPRGGMPIGGGPGWGIPGGGRGGGCPPEPGGPAWGCPKP